MKIAPKTFAEVGAAKILKCKYVQFGGEFERRWMAQFGTTPTVCSILWEKIDPPLTMKNVKGGGSAKPFHLLWSLMFLKIYATESVTRTTLASMKEPTTEKTYRKWVKIFVKAISFLESEVVSYISFHCQLVCY